MQGAENALLMAMEKEPEGSIELWSEIKSISWKPYRMGVEQKRDKKDQIGFDGWAGCISISVRYRKRAAANEKSICASHDRFFSLQKRIF